MKQTPKQFFSTPAGKLTLAIIAMVLCWTVLIVYISSNAAGGTLFPTEAHMNHVRQEIKKNTTTLNTEEKNLREFDDLQDKYEASLTTFWNADRDGQPETELRNLINDAAERAKANLQTLGSVRTSNINSELSYADIDFTVVDEYDKVIRFFAEVEKCTPRLAWRRVELRVEPTRARAVTAPGAARATGTAATATTTPAQMFRTTGQVRVIKYSPAGNASAKTATATTAKTGTAVTTAAKPATTTPATTTPAATSSTPAAQQPEEKAAAPADAPAKTEHAADDATTNKENGK
ncbi:MAG: hypothetical protein IJ926_02375 [Firmicutes bacterium]|nr:hypothetical protein [Bacillota bacterium]